MISLPQTTIPLIRNGTVCVCTSKSKFKEITKQLGLVHTECLDEGTVITFKNGIHGCTYLVGIFSYSPGLAANLATGIALTVLSEEGEKTIETANTNTLFLRLVQFLTDFITSPNTNDSEEESDDDIT